MTGGIEVYLAGLLAVAAGALVWPRVAARHSTAAGWLSAIVPAALFVWLAAHSGEVTAGRIPQVSLPWCPPLDVSLTFRLDGPALLLSMLVTGIGVPILVYGGAYFKGSAAAGPFFGFVQVFLVAMAGIACAGDLIGLFVFWELTGIASYFLIGLRNADADARDSALKALLVTGTGGLALLAGFLLLGAAGGTFQIAELQARGDAIRTHPHYAAILALVLAGAFTKSAQVPFHFWLPSAMAAPTPVSAYLHSATMVKAGVYLLAVMNPVLGGTPLWHDTLIAFGAVTMLAGAALALAQTDLKLLLAYSTVSALGILVMLLGIGTETAVTAAMVFLIVHALYKAPLFMVAGIVDKATGTRDVTQLHGLCKPLPIAALAGALAAFSMSGIPPFLGFVGKELIYEAQSDSSRWSMVLTGSAVLANAILVAVALKAGISPFLRRGRAPEVAVGARGFSLPFGPMLPACAAILLGWFPGVFVGEAVRSAVRDIIRQPADVSLSLWHGVNLPLLLSALTLAAGLGIYRCFNVVRNGATSALRRFPVGPDRLFDASIPCFLRGSSALTRAIQHGNLRVYLAVILVCLSALVAASLAATGWPGPPQSGPIRFMPTAVAGMMAIAGVLAIRSRTTVMAVLAMGGVGYGTALLYSLFGAPDLALTQVLVETLTLVLFALVMRRLPPVQLPPRSSRRRRASDAAIALTAGVALTAALLAVRAHPIPDGERMSAAMAARSLSEANGRNVVNVILVDFRALDTMGEISVLAIAGLGVAGLLLGAHGRNDESERAVATPLFRVSVSWLAPLLFFLSVFLLFRGHNAPGGGFIGGLVAGAGLILRRLAAADRRAHGGRTPVVLIAAGLATAIGSALPSVLLHRPFMEGIWVDSLWLPVVGTTKFGTPFLFDIGVYLVVVGVCLLILSRMIRSESPPAAARN